MPRMWAATGWQGVPIVLFDLVKGIDGANITQASLATNGLTAKIFSDASREQIGSTIQLVIADCIFDTVQTVANDARYTGDGGFNLRATIPGTYLRTFSDDALVRIEVYFKDTATPQNTSVDVWQITAKEVLGFQS